MTSSTVTGRLLRSFDAPPLGTDTWNRLLAGQRSDCVFLTREWQSSWWETLGDGELLLALAERHDQVVALAPFFTKAGMVYFVGSGSSDYLDFIGDVSEPEIIDTLLTITRQHTPHFIGFVFYHMPEWSENRRWLEAAASRLGLRFFEEGDHPVPVLEMAAHRDVALAAPEKKSLVRHHKFFARDGSLVVQQLRTSAEILPHLEEFFAQHRDRWAGTRTQSLFCDPAQQNFYRRLASAGAEAGWMRFMRLDWQGRPIAFHFGFNYRGSFLWYKPSFDIALARHSPGEVLLRQLLLAALDEQAHTFDFGLGDEAFKARFATRIHRVRNWGLYDPQAVQHETPAPNSF